MTYDYNSSREKLILPEYGRNIQKMVNHIKTIEDREERNKAARTVIGVMGNLNPHLRDVNDFKHKLWDHLAIIADYQGDPSSALTMGQEALDIWDELGDQQGVAWANSNLGNVYLHLGNAIVASEKFKTGLILSRDNGIRWLFTIALEGLAGCAAA